MTTVQARTGLGELRNLLLGMFPVNYYGTPQSSYKAMGNDLWSPTMPSHSHSPEMRMGVGEPMAEDYAKPPLDSSPIAGHPYARHPHYYFPDGNLYILVSSSPPSRRRVGLTLLQTEDIMFNVHRSVFPSRDPSVHWSGRSEQYPLRVKDLRRTDLELFLSFIYPSLVLKTSDRSQYELD